jgi:hypothetical protein
MKIRAVREGIRNLSGLEIEVSMHKRERKSAKKEKRVK